MMHINRSKSSTAAATAVTLFTLATIAFIAISARVINNTRASKNKTELVFVES
jgi:hypothetical protein